MNTPPAPTDANWQPPSLEELGTMLPQYEFIQLLGVGGMGAVYKARQIALDRMVAVKIMPPTTEDGDIDYAERFKIEARTLARLSHVGIVAVYDFGQTSAGQLYFVMEYVDGTDVGQMLKAAGRLPQAHALAIIAHVCDALSCAHAQAVVHRDIKPANILIARSGQVKVADFGLASLGGQQDRSMKGDGIVLGTPDFVAPEMLILGAPVDGRADIHAVGVMLYNMLTGQLPATTQQPASALLPGEVDPRLDAVITRATHPDPSLRHASVQELRAELDRIAFTPRAVAESSASFEGMEDGGLAPAASAPQPRSRPLLAGLAAAAMMLLGLGWFLFKPGDSAKKDGQETAAPSTASSNTSPAGGTPPAPAAMDEARSQPKAPQPRPEAPLGDLRHPDGQRYRFVPGRYDRAAALAKAAELGARLARVDTHEKVDWLWENLVIRGLFVGQRVWVDGVAAEAGGWRWSDGSPAGDELPWGAEQPNEKTFPAYADIYRDDDSPGIHDFSETDAAWQEESVGILIEFPAKTETAPAVAAAPAPAMPAPMPAESAPPAPPAAEKMPAETAPPPAPPAPAPEPVREPTAVEKRLAQLDASFQAACQRDAGKAYSAALQMLNQGYLGALSRARAAAQAKGSLDEVTAIDAERTLIEKGETPPPADLPSTPASLAAMRQTWRATQLKHATERDRRLLPLHQRYLDALSAYEAELTRADQIADARTVREARERVRAAMPQAEGAPDAASPAVAGGRTAPPSPATPTAAGGSWRQLATWVIGLGGTVEVVGRDGQALRAQDARALPSGRFDITGIYLPDGTAAKATDKDFTLLITARGLRELHLSGARLTTLEPLKALPQLTSISFEECTMLEDAVLADALGTLPSLAELRLYRGHAGPACLKALAACPRLALLDLNGCPDVDDRALSALAASTSLQELRLHDLPRLKDEGISRLGEQSRVRELSIEGQQHTGEGWDTFGRQAQLSSLSVYNTRLSAGGVAAIARITSLRQLALDGCALTDEMLEPFAATSRLEALSLEGNPLSGTGLRFFSANQDLRSLAVDGDSPVQDEALGLIVSQWPRLEVLELGPGAYTLAGFTRLAELKQLTELTMEQPQADDTWAAALERMARLKTLTLEDWKITGTGLGSLHSLKPLNHLRLNTCKSVDDSAVPVLRGFKRLSELYLNECGLTPEGMAQLRKALPASTYVGN